MLSLVDAHAADWEESQDRGALVREDDSEDDEGGLFATLPFPSGKDPVNKAPAKSSAKARYCNYGYPWSTCQLARDGGAAIGEFGGADGLSYCEHHAGSEHALTKGGCRGDIDRNECRRRPRRRRRRACSPLEAVPRASGRRQPALGSASGQGIRGGSARGELPPAGRATSSTNNSPTRPRT